MNSLAATPEVVADDRFDLDGFQIVPGMLSPEACDSLASDLSALLEEEQKRNKSKIGGVRNLIRRCPAVARLASAPRISSLLESLTGQAVFPVRSIFFDKTPEANWRVPWHQDLTIAVARRIDTPGFEAWSLKDEVVHVQPPAEILAGLITLRFHLDACDAANGALKVVAGSHTKGKMSAAEIARAVENEKPTRCEVPRGGAMVMRPLLIHSSSPAINPSHRRVLHIEYATKDLPNGLRWGDA